MRIEIETDSAVSFPIWAWDKVDSQEWNPEYDLALSGAREAVFERIRRDEVMGVTTFTGAGPYGLQVESL